MQRELSYVKLTLAWINSCTSILVFSVGSEQFPLDKEHNSKFEVLNFFLGQKRDW